MHTDTEEYAARQQALRDTLSSIRRELKTLSKRREAIEQREGRNPLHDTDRGTWRPMTASPPSRRAPAGSAYSTSYSIAGALATGCEEARRSLSPAEFLNRSLHVSRELPDRLSLSSSSSYGGGVSLSQLPAAVAIASRGRAGRGYDETSTSFDDGGSWRRETVPCHCFASRQTAWVARHLDDAESRESMLAAYASHRYAPRFAPGSHTDLAKSRRVQVRQKELFMKPTTFPCSFTTQAIYM